MSDETSPPTKIDNSVYPPSPKQSDNNFTPNDIKHLREIDSVSKVVFTTKDRLSQPQSLHSKKMPTITSSILICISMIIIANGLLTI